MEFSTKKFSDVTFEDLSSFVKEVKANGYISNVDHKDAVYRASRMLERAFEKEVSSTWHHGRGSEVYNTIHDDKLEDLYDYYVYGPANVKTAQKKLLAVKSSEAKNHPVYQAYKDFIDRHLKGAEEFLSLKDLVIPAKEAKERDKQKTAPVIPKAVMVSKEKLEKILEKYIEEFVEEAGKRAAKLYTEKMNQLKAGGGIDVFAPKPDSNKRGTDEYKRAENKRAYFLGLIAVKKSGFVKFNKDAARQDYLNWVSKMTGKISKPMKSATMTGSPWINSIISITTVDDETQVWYTKMIINQSKLGNLFNQFPTRQALDKMSKK